MKVGIIGVGFMGATHLQAWTATPAQIAGLSAEPAAEAEPFGAQYGCKVYPNWEALVPEVDVVDICTPTHLHYEMAMRAAASGKDIVCEKPLALTVEQAREMVAACRRAGVRLLVGHVVRFFPEYALAKAAVAGGEIGRPGVIRLHRGSYRPKKPAGNWFLDEAKSGGILMDLMIHDFDYARWIAGDVTRVFARKITGGHPDAPVDYGLAILTHKNGALSHIAGAWAYPPPTFRTSLEIAGDRGLIQFDSDGTMPIHNLTVKPPGDAPDVAIPRSPLAESPYLTQIKEFYQALVHDRPARVSGEDGLAAVQIARAAIQSAQTGAAVDLEAPEEVRS
jgi:predicted dehydrogenase